MSKILKVIGNIYVVLMLFAYPLVLTNKYYNVTDTKLYFFYISTAIFTIAVFSVVYIGWLKGNMKVEVFEKKTLIIVASILGSALVGLFRSENKWGAVSGVVEYGFGVAFLLILLLGVIAISFSRFSICVFVVASLMSGIIAAILGFMQFLGIDLFNLIKSVTIEDPNTFMSTFGNISFFGFFMVLIFPFALYGLWEMDESYRYISLVGTVATFIGTIITNTDATLLAFIVEALLLVAIQANKGNFDNIALLAIVLGASVIGLNLLLFLSTRERELGGIQKIFINPLVWAVILIVFVILYKFSKDSWKEFGAKITNVISKGGLLIISIVPFVAMIYTKVTYINLESPISRLLYLDENWGNFRGFLWSRSIELFNNGTTIDKLFGRGVGTFSDLFQQTYSEEFIELYHIFYNDAHNMFLQWLVEYGVVGIIMLGICFIVILYSLYKSERKFDHYRAIAFVAGIISATCLITQNITPAFLVMFL